MLISDIVRYRLLNQGIAEIKSEQPGQIVFRLGAVQAQDYPGTLWALGLRTLGATQVDIEQAIIDRKIIRTWPMRGTLHFVAATDIRWMLPLLTPRIVAGSASRHRQLGLDEAVFARSKDLFVEALQGGQLLPRPEIYELLERNNISAAGQRGIHIISRLAQEGLICFGPHSNKQPTFALLDEWVPAAKILERDEALAELAKRYFRGHGPATLQDFVWWSGLRVADARLGLEMVKTQFEQEVVEGQTYWLPPDIADLPSQASSIYLLPGFDEYLLGYTNRSAALDPLYSQKIVPGNNGMFMPTIVSNGRIVGTWKRTFKKDRVIIKPEPFNPLSQIEKSGLEMAAERYGRFMNLESSLTL